MRWICKMRTHRLSSPSWGIKVTLSPCTDHLLAKCTEGSLEKKWNCNAKRMRMHEIMMVYDVRSQFSKLEKVNKHRRTWNMMSRFSSVIPTTWFASSLICPQKLRCWCAANESVRSFPIASVLCWQYKLLWQSCFKGKVLWSVGFCLTKGNNQEATLAEHVWKQGNMSWNKRMRKTRPHICHRSTFEFALQHSDLWHSIDDI